MTTDAEKVVIQQAHLDGAVIEFLFKDGENWLVCNDPIWSWPDTDYRRSPESVSAFKQWRGEFIFNAAKHDLSECAWNAAIGAARIAVNGKSLDELGPAIQALRED